MKSKEPGKTMEQQAAEIIASKNIRLFWNDRGTVGIEWDDLEYNTKTGENEAVRKVIPEADRIYVEIFRGDRTWIINYFVKIHISYLDRKNGSEYEFFATMYTAEKAFAIKDLLDDMISEFRSSQSA